MKHVEVGMWKLPGITFKADRLTSQLTEEILAWATENHCGTCMEPGFWSFKNAAQRDWFILRWSEQIPVEEKKEKL